MSHTIVFIAATWQMSIRWQLYIGLAVGLGTVSLAFGPNSTKGSTALLTDPIARRKPQFSLRATILLLPA
jgi:hypothetical protein